MASEIVHADTQKHAESDEDVPPPPPLHAVPSASQDESSTNVVPPVAASPNANPNSSQVLVLGGAGFIGRHLLEHITRRKLASHITIADKSMVATSNMNAVHKPLYEDKQLVTFKQADLSKDSQSRPTHHATNSPVIFRSSLCFILSLILSSSHRQSVQGSEVRLCVQSLWPVRLDSVYLIRLSSEVC